MAYEINDRSGCMWLKLFTFAFLICRRFTKQLGKCVGGSETTSNNAKREVDGSGFKTAFLAIHDRLWRKHPTSNSRASFVEGRGIWSSSPTQCSAFTWFLRSVIRRRKLDEQCEQTLALLSQVMGEHSGHKHAHVMRTMFRHAKCYKVLGPVFYQL
jgi:hypothetical protein